MPDHPTRIIAFDGGGIRGIITALWVDALERRLGGPLRDHVDLVAGTSTGGLLACGLGAGLRGSDLVDLYRQRGRNIFPDAARRLWGRVRRIFRDGVSAPKYEPDGLERELDTVFGDLRFGDLTVRHTLVTAYDVLKRQAVVFKTPDARYDGLRVRDICRATSAAPTYFPAHVMQIGHGAAPLVDGGVVANNPTACAIAEALRLQREAGGSADPAGLVVGSFGTGSTTRPIGIDESREWGAIEWAIPVIDVLFDGAADATDYIARQIVPEGRYFRFQTRLDRAYDDMDNADETNLTALLETAQRHLERPEVDAKIKGLAELLQQPAGAGGG